jgi:hypothetical protein
MVLAVADVIVHDARKLVDAGDGCLKAASPLVVGLSNRSEVGGERKSVGPHGTRIFKRA